MPCCADTKVELLDGADACPPEDCGGDFRYAELCERRDTSKPTVGAAFHNSAFRGVYGEVANAVNYRNLLQSRRYLELVRKSEGAPFYTLFDLESAKREVRVAANPARERKAIKQEYKGLKTDGASREDMAAVAGSCTHVHCVTVKLAHPTCPTRRLRDCLTSLPYLALEVESAIPPPVSPAI
ncbi:hypothetical protein CYMTET_56633 [Cymbomonas tetramitiformis]|uniref:Uncharacterized protein n=1 Tax=Cymbomonas tetramitiformis TaxID=36881 RepID=A0AAE0EMD2_9CHLO|nr:hypothetical protein CYMTET_56633 [Cymbomonas tetramitiformis]|eukprot:gene34383-biopygen28083